MRAVVIPYFNPRSHERSDIMPKYEYLGKKISIHAPTRGATMLIYTNSTNCTKFQSTLPREERLSSFIFKCICFTYFNPRSHERSDKYAPALGCLGVSISIHAPTRGATAILHKKFVYFYTIPTINI